MPAFGQSNSTGCGTRCDGTAATMAAATDTSAGSETSVGSSAVRAATGITLTGSLGIIAPTHGIERDAQSTAVHDARRADESLTRNARKRMAANTIKIDARSAHSPRNCSVLTLC